MKSPTVALKTCILLVFTLFSLILDASSPNILFIIGDDMGIDAIDGFGVGKDHPKTPNIDQLRKNGLTFANAWAAPVCSATRASLMTGKYGINNGVNSVPGVLSTEHKSIFTEIKEQSNGEYTTCVVGKWHLSRKRDLDHPYTHGVDHFMGVVDAGVSDYYNWDKVEDGVQESCTTYVTQYFTDYAIEWINKQDNPWLMWLAHVAPHSPFHWPPEELYVSTEEDGNSGKYKAMIESLDYEIGRLLDNIPKAVLKNTVVVFLGDNGTPGRLIKGFPLKRGKQTVYQGGVCAPLVVTGKGVSRKGETEDALVNISDFYATFSQIVNPKAYPNGSVNDGLSFKHLLSGDKGDERSYNYMAMGANRQYVNSSYTVRDDQFKLLDLGDGVFEFYDISVDAFERDNLLDTDMTNDQTQAYDLLLKELSRIRDN